MASIGEERERRQAKVFTKWVNSYLSKKQVPEVTDLTEAFDDGVNLCILYEVISDEKLPRWSMKPRGMIGRTNNLAIVLKPINTFVKEQGIQLSYSPQQIADGDRRQILGMLWILISKFVIPDSEADLSAKRSLLRWVQRVTEPYSNVDVKDFTRSWKDGLAFNALLHQYDNSLMNWGDQNDSDPAANLEQAFGVAEGLGIYRLLDVDDITEPPIPDEKSVMTYVSTMYQFFKSRVGEMLKRESEQFVIDCGNLIKWIKASIATYSQLPEFTEDEAWLQGLMDGLHQFNAEKSRYADYKVALYVKLASIQRRQRNERLAVFVPSDDRNLTVIHKLWEELNTHLVKYSNTIRDYFDRIEELKRQREMAAKKARQEAEAAMLIEFNSAATEFMHWITETQTELTTVEEVAEDAEDESTDEDTRARRTSAVEECRAKLEPVAGLWDTLVSENLTEWASIQIQEVRYAVDTMIFALVGEETDALKEIQKIDLKELEGGAEEGGEA